MEWPKMPARNVLLPWVLPALATLAVLLWLRFAPNQPAIYVPMPGPTQYVPVPVKVAGKTVTVPGPERVVLVPSVIVSEKMKWPEIANDNILAVGEVAPYRGKTSVVAVADIRDNTMTTRLISRQEKMPFFALEREFGVRGGVGTGGLVLGELYGRFVRIGPIVVEGRAYGMRNDRDGADFGAAILADYKF